MTFRLSDRIVRLPEQFFSGLTRRVAGFQQAGYDVINLGQGNPDLPTPPHIVEALRGAVLDPVTHRYPPFRGLPELKEAAAEFYQRTYGVALDPEREIAILVGGKTGLVEVAELYLETGDVALVPDPGYPDYLSGIALAGAEPYALPITASNSYIPDLDAVPEDVWKRARVWYINYPNNPTGAGATTAFFEQAIEKARHHGVLIVHDFAYGAIGYDHHRPPSFLQMKGAKEVGIEIYTLSKTFNMAGWRVAFAVGHPEVIEHINLIQDHYYVSIFAAVQRASIAALHGPADDIEALRQTYQRRRDAFLGALRAAGIHAPSPQGSFFCWIPLPEGVSSVAFAEQLLEQAHVAVAPGRGFGEHGEGHVRVGLLAPEDRLIEAAERMAQFWTKRF
ncbi:aminotransferase class I/II-fold pyridoxal phosphate-dependent enzyme [Alicyclobacillus mali]|uniref:Aminotransferase class I/II-fold pyridoxal phosphate-dependent enzyme n=1 Tax=Alicyclobacillus mali (ex Roth et al. 2021) TaxID=1123961 RepID=A0ABS0F198_9BACL|nr:aminotransferase class I/II-fold pyridoxal phosphate-dependent enzyme [Alicyclobacillus mali (ex Roth et al. 2021)]MBF8377042.1 aminotransferase class I/II-fold pyridoxal phosphate-dependent enzyme [Alicyclobacillus mali (ex Roth et al. 2021)]MCL6488363.1 aminotransferase class I/II-fold pyridoxal phosphate-dependent enzyme [Alicyclobacillus mali (ex Roth et al. 2021)]